MSPTRRRRIFGMAAWTAGVLAGLGALAHEATAGGKLAAPPNERWKAECGSCHIAYPPRLLAREAWHRIMSGLDRHFGTDASLDAPAVAEIGDWLERHSGPSARAQPSAGGLRISETPWFVHEHDEVPPQSWKHPAVRSPANCAACHTTADEGDFRERNIRIPR
jgi:diheme cytochrome c